MTDTGIGMNAATQDAHLRAVLHHQGARARAPGSGLATVFGIVKQSGGHIWSYSEPGHGTTFKLYFPASHERPCRRRGQQPPAVTLLGAETILLVEDEPAVRSFVARALRQQGYGAGRQQRRRGAADRRATRGRDHLLLTDVIMPRVSGSNSPSGWARCARRACSTCPATPRRHRAARRAGIRRSFMRSR